MTDRIMISDKTLKQNDSHLSLSFREKIDLCRLVDRLGADWIELPPIENMKIDRLLIKAVSSAVKQSGVAVAVSLSSEWADKTWEALSEAGRARLQVSAPVSSVQMEYLYHQKPQGMRTLICDCIRKCASLTDEVEFIAEDAGRSDRDFLIQIIRDAAAAGAKTVTLCESAGTMLPDEFGCFVENILSAVSDLQGVVFGVDCSDGLSLADACAVEAVRRGIREIKAASCRLDCASLKNVVNILSRKGELFGVSCAVHREEILRVTDQIEDICRPDRGSHTSGAAENPGRNNEVPFSLHDSPETVLRSIRQLGYDLTEEDQKKVLASFRTIAEKKGKISIRELDAIVAAEAMQVPPAYRIDSYVINTGNDISAMAHMKLFFHQKPLEGISLGDGAIDAAFMAIEKATGKHYELDDFQIQAITEGREAMGETVVRLRSEGRLFSGRGISTDIIGSGIMAYLNALNKIVYEEEIQ